MRSFKKSFLCVLFVLSLVFVMSLSAFALSDSDTPSALTPADTSSANNDITKNSWQQTADGKWQYYKNNQYVTGWKNDIPGWEGRYFYFNNNGVMTTGWKSDIPGWQGTYFYFNDNGVMATGWKCDIPGWQGTYFYFNDNGAMATGWKCSIPGYTQDEWFYFGTNGVMVSDWQVIDGFWYYFYKQNDPNGGVYGLMASNCYINGYYVNDQGRWENLLGDMTALANTLSSKTGYIILVNKSTHKVGVFTGSQSNWNNLFYWDCADGAVGMETPEGLFSVSDRGTSFVSEGQILYWWTRISGDYLFHSTPYDQYGNSVDPRVGLAISHGCVRLQIDNAKWIYDNLPAGTSVYIYH